MTVAADRIGADLIFLNTMFAAPQVSEVCEQERPIAIVYDEEFSETVAAASEGRTAFVAWADAAGSSSHQTLDQLRTGQSTDPLDPPVRIGGQTEFKRAPATARTCRAFQR